MPTTSELISEIVAGDSRFSEEAYEFAVEAMINAFAECGSEHSAEKMPDEKLGEVKIPSNQVVVALRRLASERFGKCAAATFNLWGVTRWQDFAAIVSRLQEAEVSLFSFLAFNPDDFKSRGALDDVFPER